MIMTKISKKLLEAQQEAFDLQHTNQLLMEQIAELRDELAERDMQIRSYESEIKRLRTGIEDARDLLKNIR